MTHEEKRLQGEDNFKWGREAEQIAADYFLTHGYSIRERNWKCAHIEIDLILELGRTIVFVEVKARNGDNQDPADAVNSKKKIKMVRGADIYLSHLDHFYYYRFDIFTITGTREQYTIAHYPDAFLSPVNRR